MFKLKNKACIYIIFIAFLPYLAYSQTFQVQRLDGDPSTMTISDPIIDENTFINTTGFNSNVSATSTLLNINGPSVIRVPAWIPNDFKIHEKANYYMYFAHHGGKSIRIAWAEYIDGPWEIFNYGFAPDRTWGYTGGYTGLYCPGDGVLDLNLGANPSTLEIDANYTIGNHIASPDVVVDDVNQRIVMYFHGYAGGIGSFSQQTWVATSKYGLNFNLQTEGGEIGQGPRAVVPGSFYFRTFEIEGEYSGNVVRQSFAFANKGLLYKAPTVTTADVPALIENGDDMGGLWHPLPVTMVPWWTLISTTDNPLYQIDASPVIRPDGDLQRLLGGNIDSPRHFAVYHDPVSDRDHIYVLYTGRGDAPESVVLVILDLSGLSEIERLDPSLWKRKLDVEKFILEPEEDWEGADLPLEYSSDGAAINKRQLRDPYLFRDTDGEFYLFYTGEGEEAIGVAHLILTQSICVEIKAFLQGPYDSSTNDMKDDLRIANSIPTDEPYTALGYTGIQNANAQVSNNILTIAGNNAVVDWVLVELRDATHTIIATRVGLVQRDGDIVEADGTPMSFESVAAGTYHISVRHRNHLGVMTQVPVSID